MIDMETRERALKEFINRLKKRYANEIKKVMLFGSHARGDQVRESDIDLLIVVEKRTIDIEREIVDLSFDILMEFSVDISPKVYSEYEFNLEKRLGAPFMRNVEREGVALT